MRERGRHERLVEHVLRRCEPSIDVAERPLGARGAHRQRGFAGRGEIRGRPLDGLHSLLRHDVAVGARVGPGRKQARERIDDVRQRLVLDFDALDGFLRELLAARRDRQDSIADEQRLVRENRLARSRRRRHVVGRQHGDHAFHRERFGRVDLDARVRHRAREQPAEQHAVGAEVFRVLGLAGHFGREVGRREILTEKRVSHELSPR